MGIEDTENLYSTASHSNDFIESPDYKNLDSNNYEGNLDLAYHFKVYYRYLRKTLKLKSKKEKTKAFTDILFVTLDCPPYSQNSSREDNPLDYITELRKQYPYNNFKILIPIINIENSEKTKKLSIEIDEKTEFLEKTSISFKFFLQNRIQKATVYKFPKNSSNIDIYGIYSPIFSKAKDVSEITKLHYLAPFITSARIAIKKIKEKFFDIDIVHCENIPYYLGVEFQKNQNPNIKVLQTINDFTQIEFSKTEAFWSVINLVDKNNMKKICRDEIIKKCIAKLFNLNNTKSFYQMKDCLNFVYKNYYNFRKYIDKNEDINENIIFKRLNIRATEIYKNCFNKEDLNYNPMAYTLKKADYWSTVSKSYYEDIFNNEKISKDFLKIIENTKEKSCYFDYGCKLKKYPKEETRLIYENFNKENFREFRNKNKNALLKELSYDRIKTNFVDPTLFKNEEVEIYGSLDSFYEAPILLANLNTPIFANGIDILFNTLSKLFELHKNIQIIICIKNGLKNNYIKNWLDFISEKKYLDGRWVFIDGEINLPKFLAASDMFLLPTRLNSTNIEHLIAMNYGCIPIVSRYGFLNDSVIDIFDDIINGCGLKTSHSLLNENANDIFFSAVIKALNLYQNNPNSWNILIKNSLNNNSNWNFKILEKYNNVYQKLL